MNEPVQPSEAFFGPQISKVAVPDSRHDAELESPGFSGATEVRKVNDAVAADFQAKAAAHSAVPKASAPTGATSEANHVPLSRCSLPTLATAPRGRHHRRLSSLSVRSPMSALGSRRHVDILSEDMPQPTLAAGRGEVAQQVVEAIKDDLEPMVTGLNLRDVATTSPETIRCGLAFRSSQVFSKNEMKELHIQSAIDLRAEPHDCKKARKHSIATGIAVAPLKLLPDRLKLHVHRALPLPCELCSKTEGSASGNIYKCRLTVYHVDMLPKRVKLQIFRDMPWSIRLRTITAPLCNKSPQEVMTPAVANPNVLGYLKLYIMMLDMSMQQIAKALRVFASEDNLPCVVHCIHGKDRTGLVMALLLLTLGVPEEVVVLDYAKSEVELKTGREGGALAGELDDYLIRDDIIASSAQTMEDTLRYLNARYRGIRNYLRIIGITRWEVHDIRKTLLEPEGSPRDEDILSAFSMGSRASMDGLRKSMITQPIEAGKRLLGWGRHGD